MSEKILVDHIFVSLEPRFQYYVEVRNPENTVQLLEVLSLRNDIHAKQYGVQQIVVVRMEEVGMSVECLMSVIIEEIREILKWGVD
ncbi:hypothetical protein TNCV_2934741 [Trichonephila clavipes]|nr:hypothetical protein TNCV_2934741 [Trichonephila clavipes]